MDYIAPMLRDGQNHRPAAPPGYHFSDAPDEKGGERLVPNGTDHAGDRSPLRILLVDDNEDAVRGLEKLLGFLGFDVVGTSHGFEALDVGPAFMPDVVVLDLGMPDMNGYEVAERIRAAPWGAAVRIIALTGWGQPEDIRRSMEAGFEAHLVKPLKTPELLALLRRSTPDQ